MGECKGRRPASRKKRATVFAFRLVWAHATLVRAIVVVVVVVCRFVELMLLHTKEVCNSY